MFQMRAPLMAKRDYEPATMKVRHLAKGHGDHRRFRRNRSACATPMFTLTQPVYSEAMAMGLGEQDTASCSKY